MVRMRLGLMGDTCSQRKVILVVGKSRDEVRSRPCEARLNELEVGLLKVEFPESVQELTPIFSSAVSFSSLVRRQHSQMSISPSTMVIARLTKALSLHF